MSVLGPAHTSRVRVLFKAILRLHRGMPQELKALGDQYVKDEFRRHKDADPQFVPVFMNEWTVGHRHMPADFSVYRERKCKRGTTYELFILFFYIIPPGGAMIW